ncbi:hypothetical protein [Micromonospora inaquosa]|uniref:hypothetical protein n=1 Tax=Micromonospora inaquosa TaxID=2203716 RepID=UPI000F5F1633|nr:hypothetical protein [Micromonospora inaquosa]
MTDLERLGKIVEELHSARLRELEAEEQQRRSAFKVAEGINIVGDSNSVYITPGDGEVYPFVGLVVEDEDEVAGPISEVLPEIDRRSVASLKFVAALWPAERLSVTFSRNASEAVVIDVVSGRTGWAKQAYARLADEIEKGVPRWSPLRSENSRFGLAVSVAAVLGGFVGLVLAKSAGWDVRLVVGGLVFMATWPILLMQRLHNWMFPAFELQGEGGQSSGTRRLVTLCLLGASIPIGALVNAIS